MKLTKTIFIISICLTLFIFPVGNLGLISPAVAAKPSMTFMPKEEVSHQIDEFMHKIPGNYYNINKVGKIKKLAQGDRTLFIDVRQPSEYRQGHIPGAINIPLRSLTENLDKIPRDRSVVLYCSSGYRTGIGIAALQLLGYNQVKGFAPSINGWKQAGEPLEK